jgi:hypothetical protein
VNAREMGRAMRDALSVSTRETMLVAHQLLTNATPVDTEHAASNWLLSVGGPVTSVAGSRAAVNWGPWRDGRAVIAAYDVRQGQIFMRQNVGYVVHLNRGHSQQAPAGFVEAALAGAAYRAPAGTRKQTAAMLRAFGRASLSRGGRPRRRRR